MKNMKNYLFSLLAVAAIGFTSCEGPMGPPGPAGADGTNGTDANESCKLCHDPDQVDMISLQFNVSRHGHGEAALEEGGSTSCGPCHLSAAFQYVVNNDIPATFTGDVNNYASVSTAVYGEIVCSTCHPEIHATYGGSDLPALIEVGPVAMTMWAGAQTIDNLPADDGASYLCVKCHQPRPFTKSALPSGQRVPLDYADLVNNPSNIFGSYLNIG
jgi:hypothetical protein